ncbi:glutathione S-transferase 1-like [Diabrotica virgifera virgifera]|uniref:Glutathione S-transferase 1-like n=1 Tax=Diabrotica virgifera virgifera TaxID=50390 RepID=A0ABM5K2T4_DIAVI|nr:glutathione S-transferase 1-like [Diabrotica virgifera virgifera]
MKPILYHLPPSGNSRGALLAAKVAGVDVDIQIVDIMKREQFTEAFLKINPQHTLPTLVDGDLTLWDSHAIAGYLATQYSKDDNLYPKDPKKRALVDQRLYFDCGTLYPRLRAICFPIIHKGETKIYDEHRASLEEALGFLDGFLEGNDFVTGKHLTIADCSLVGSVSSIVAIGWDVSAHSNIANWITRCALAIPDYEEANQKGADAFGQLVGSKLAPGQL